MEIRNDSLHGRRYLTANDFRLPNTYGNVPKSGQTVLDNCFHGIESMLNHTFLGLDHKESMQFPGYGILMEFAQNGLIRAGVETRADEMTRRWGKLTGGGSGKTQILETEFERFGIKNLINRAAALCGYYGGCLGFIDTGEFGEDLAYPLVLDPATLKKGSLKGIRLIEPYMVSPAAYNSTNPLADDYFRPEMWYVQGTLVHGSRLLYFAENELPVLIRPAYNFFGLSLAQKAMDAAGHFTDCRESAAKILEQHASVVLKTDMSDVLSGGYGDSLRRRLQYFINMRDNDGCAVIDKDKEDMVVADVSLAGVGDVMQQAEEYLAAMFNVPVTKMWGISPEGTAGTGDLRSHYDNIEALQKKILQTPLDKLLQVLQMNLFGEIDGSIRFEFNPLSEENEDLKRTTAGIKAGIDAIYLGTGVISPEEVRRKLGNDAASGYYGLDPDALPGRPEKGMPGTTGLKGILANDADWDESKHDRDERGRFTSGGGVAAGESENTEVKSNPVLKNLQSSGIAYHEVKNLSRKLTEREIISKVKGRNKKGPCASLALAYIANRHGFDVVDLRGADGDSNDFFARAFNDIANMKGVNKIVVNEKNEISSTMKLLRESVEPGKEYILASGEHVAVVRKVKSGFEYLELQKQWGNGYLPLDEKSLAKRFGCSKSGRTTYGIPKDNPTILIEAESLAKSEDFRYMMGYIDNPKLR